MQQKRYLYCCSFKCAKLSLLNCYIPVGTYNSQAAILNSVFRLSVLMAGFQCLKASGSTQTSKAELCLQIPEVMNCSSVQSSTKHHHISVKFI